MFPRFDAFDTHQLLYYAPAHVFAIAVLTPNYSCIYFRRRPRIALCYIMHFFPSHAHHMHTFPLLEKKKD